MLLLMIDGSTIAAAIIIFLIVILVLVALLLFAKAKLVPSGNVKVTINGEKELETPIGDTVLAALQIGRASGRERVG